MNRKGLSPRARAVLLGGQTCIATNRDGTRCRRPPIVGGFVCHFHGGNSPLAQKAAEERIARMLAPAFDFMDSTLRNMPPGNPVAANIAVALTKPYINGLHASMGGEQAPSTFASYAAWIPADRLRQIASWMADAKAAMERGEPRALEVETVEAVADDEAVTH
jgi:hypothetical protein